MGLFLMKELEMYNYLEKYKTNPGVNNIIPSNLNGRITYEDLYNFMKEHKFSFNVSDWKALLRRANCM